MKIMLTIQVFKARRDDHDGSICVSPFRSRLTTLQLTTDDGTEYTDFYLIINSLI